MISKPAILHILPHAGGGVGAVIRALLQAETLSNSPFTHHVASLEYLNEKTKLHFAGHGIAWIDEVAFKHRQEFNSLLNKADIVLVHWWNHPLIVRFLHQGLPPTRLLIWSHVNGFHAPQVFYPSLLELPYFFIFSSAASMKAPAVGKLSNTSRQKLRIIRSCSGIPLGSSNYPVKKDPFCAGYVGTVEAVKMHKNFLTMCADADLPTPCIVAGGADHEQLRQKAVALNLSKRFDIQGPVPNATDIFKKISAFAYPLSPRHYGTGEQVIIEAMAFGAVPVVLDNPTERAIVRHGETGLIAQDESEFSASLRLLMDDPARREALALGGRSFILNECGIEHSVNAFHNLFDLALGLVKRPHKLQLPSLNGMEDGSPAHLFLTSLGDSAEHTDFIRLLNGDRSFVLPVDFASKTRGSILHYLSMLGPDETLDMLSRNLPVEASRP